MSNFDTWYESDRKDCIDSSRIKERNQIDQVIDIPDWWGGALQRISYLLRLPSNWDAYGASAIKPQTAYAAVQILQQISRPGVPPPSIVPTIRGNLQFEWHAYGIDLEFEVISATKISVSFEDHVSGLEWEKDLDYNLLQLAEVVKQLVERQVETKQVA